jgi:hypothetical protein
MLLDMLLLPALPPTNGTTSGATKAILDTVFGRFRR